MARTILKNSDFLTDRPLPWNVYDTNGTLMHARGSMVDRDAKARLIKRGVLRDVDEDIGRLTLLAPDAHEGKPPPPNPDRMQGTKMPFGDTAVRPGDALNIDYGQDGSRCMARMIGYLKGKSILITVPADEQGLIYLKEGESVVIKVFSGKHVLVFPATVLAVPSKPYPHIHLSYPSVVTGFVVRKAERASVRLITAIEMGGDPITGLITDLSTGGVSFVARNAEIKPHSQAVLNFKLQLAESTFIMKLHCVVRTVRGLQSEVLEGATGYGAQFLDLSAEDILIVGLFVGQRMAEARSSSAAAA